MILLGFFWDFNGVLFISFFLFFFIGLSLLNSLYVKGNPADSRMRSAAKRRGIEITSISRPIKPSDFTDFDLILAMDNSNRCRFFTSLNLSNINGPFDNWY